MNRLIIPALAISAVFVGFLIGFGVGEKTNTAASKNTKVDYDSGKVNIEVDIGAALKNGVFDWLDGL